jgi:hypothetical protein
VELAWSPDSIQWQRLSPGTPFLRLGEKGAYDSGCIYAQAGPPVVQDGRLLIYYGGSPTVHLGWKRSASLCLARLPEDGFASYEPADPARPAVLTTSPLRPSDRPISLSCQGEVSFEKEPLADGTFRLRLTVPPGARLYAIRGAKLTRTELPLVEFPPPPKLPVQRGPLVFDFAKDAQGWQGVDQATHHPEGYLTISRANGLRPILRGQPLAGDWPVLLGGDEVTLIFRVRGPRSGGSPRCEIFAREVAAWTYEKLPAFTPDWQTLSITLRHDWTDNEARAAGWMPPPMGVSWRETLRKAGRVVLMDAQNGGLPSFDIDEVRIEAR